MNTNRSESVRIVSVPRDYLHQQFSIGKGRYGSVYKINHQELDQEDFLYAAKHCRFDVEGRFRHFIINMENFYPTSYNIFGFVITLVVIR